jgi:hypothetical protein
MARLTRPVERVRVELARYGADPDEWVARIDVLEAETRRAGVLDFPVAGYGPGAPGEVLEEVGQRPRRARGRARRHAPRWSAPSSAFDR